MAKDFFSVLSSIDCAKYVQKRNGLDYIPWAVAWKLLKQSFPESTYTVIKNAQGLNYHHDGSTAWVEVQLSLVVRDDYGCAHTYETTEMLAVMDYSKRSIPVDKLRSTDVINTLQRCLVKACARMGLGINVYGALDMDDLPEEEHASKTEPVAESSKQTAPVVDLSAIRSKLDAAIKARTQNMTRTDKVRFVEEVVSPALDGERNWRLCEDSDRLQGLLSAVSGE